MFEFGDVDQFSFNDSENFNDNDSILSWITDQDAVVNNWRGWQKPGPSSSQQQLQQRSSGTAAAAFSLPEGVSSQGCPIKRDPNSNVLTLTELAAREVALSIPFELVEVNQPPVEGLLQLAIAFYSFPEEEEDIRLYSCLANGSSEEFSKGEHLYKSKSVKDPLQIGFHLSATVAPAASGKQSHNSSVTFDRRKIVSCQCNCNSQADWCSHVVALCLHRIHQSSSVSLRAPVSDSLQRLERDQLRKFAQYLIAKLPEQILPIAQSILDDLLSPAQSEIKNSVGAPDPTLGGATAEQASWCLDGKNLKDNIRKILVKFCVPAPIVFSDVQCLSTSAPPSASEWVSFLRPLRGREPEGMWNLLSIVREMYRRNDRNSIPLLEIVTQQCLETAQIMVWWFNTKVALQQKNHGKHNVSSNSQASQNACASLCDEIVTLWKLAALNPCIAPQERETLKQRLIEYHLTVIEKVQANQGSSGNMVAPGAHHHRNAASSNHGAPSQRQNRPTDLELFPGFKPAIEACSLDWSDYPIPGVTYGSNTRYLCPFAVFRLKQNETHVQHSQVNSSQAVLRCEYPSRPRSISDQQQPPRFQQQNQESPPDEEPGKVVDELLLENPGEEVVSDEGVATEDGVPFYPHPLSSNPPPPSLQPQRSSDSAASFSDEQSIPAKEKNKRPTFSRDSSGNESSPEREEEEEEEGAAGSVENNDQYRVYFYDPKLPPNPRPSESSSAAAISANLFEMVFRNLRRTIEDSWEVLFMRAEGIHAHGYHMEACNMAVDLAHALLRNPPDLMAHAASQMQKGEGEPATMGAISKNSAHKNHHKKSIKAASHQITHTSSTTLAHCAFLCTVLAENKRYHNLAFQVGMFGLELARPPASTKPMEVRLAHQETELVGLLKKIPLGPDEMTVIRERALQLKEGTLKSRGEALLPLNLASFVFESLVLTSVSDEYSFRNPGDEQLGFEAAVAAIGLKANVSEADHPLLCEGTRRQRGDLALMLLTNYKDSPECITKIMDRLLDREIHPQFKSPILPTYYVCNGSRAAAAAAASAASAVNQPQQLLEARMANLGLEQPPLHLPPPPMLPHLAAELMRQLRRHDEANGTAEANWVLEQQQQQQANLRRPASQGNNVAAFGDRRTEHQPPALLLRPQNVNGSGPGSDSGSSGNSSGADSIDSSSTSSRNQQLAARDRQVNQGIIPPPNVAPTNNNGGLRLSSSYPLMENFLAAAANATAASVNAVNVSGIANAAVPVHNSSQQPQTLARMGMPLDMANLNRNSIPNIKVNRYKGKRQYPSIPNQPSESSAHFMNELAKMVLNKAGGSSSSSNFTDTLNEPNIRGPHRALQMAAFQIGLYALGLHNRVSPNWLSRTYSSHVSWITAQAMELGASALSFLIGTWEGHLTPPEAANIADKASKSRDAAMVRSGAALALSALPHAAALNPNEIQRAIQQCKEQRNEMLEKACEAVENAATGGGVYPEVLFEVARHWYDLFKKHQPSLEDLHQPHHHMQQQQHQLHFDHQHQLAALHDNHGQSNNVLLQMGSPNFPPLPVQPPSLQVGLPFPVYSFVPGFPPSSAAFAANAFTAVNAAAAFSANSANHPSGGLMFVTPPPQNAAAAAAAFHFQNAAALQPRFGQVFQLGLAAPLLPAPPPTNPLQAAHHLMAAHHHQQQQQHQRHNVAGAVAVAAAAAAQNSGVNAASAQKYLLAAYRVGMLALDNLGKRINEDRWQARFAKMPTYGDDVKWLHTISQKLGLQYVEKFLIFVLNTIVSPFILQELVWECGLFLASTATGLSQANVQYSTVVHQIRTQHHLANLLTRCCHMYYQCFITRLHHITPNDYDDLVSILMSAKQTFMWAGDGAVSFNALLHAIKKNKGCKKELWQKIVQTQQLDQQAV